MKDQGGVKKGFTLVEIMIVVGVVLLLSAIAIPNLLRARIAAQEGAAVAAVRTLLSAQTAYRASHSQYANLTQLSNDLPPYIDGVLAAGTKQGYSFTIDNISANSFFVTAAPQVSGQSATFYSDEGGIMCRSDNTSTAAPNTHSASGCPSGFSEVE